MNLQSIIAVALRLMALDLVLRAALELSPKIFQLVRVYRTSPATESTLDAAFPWLLLFGLAASAVLLWSFALPIARLVTRSLPQDISLGTLTLADCYSVAFIGFGLYCVGSRLPQVLTWCYFLFKEAASTSGNSWKDQLSYEVAGIFMQFALGVLLFVKGRTWALALAHRDRELQSPNPYQARAVNRQNASITKFFLFRFSSAERELRLHF